MSTKVTTQAGLDEALADPAVETIEIASPHGVWLTIRDDRGKRVVAYDTVKVVAYNMATVEAYGTATVVASGSVKLVDKR